MSASLFSCLFTLGEGRNPLLLTPEFQAQVALRLLYRGGAAMSHWWPVAMNHALAEVTAKA